MRKISIFLSVCIHPIDDSVNIHSNSTFLSLSESDSSHKEFIAMTSTSKLLIKLLLLQISVLHCFHLPNNPFDSVKQSSRFLDIESSKKLVKFLNEVKSNFGWIYNATVPHGYNITENSYNVPVYSKIEPEGELELTGYTKDYIIEPEDSDDDVKKIPTEMTMFEKFERFKNNIDLMFMTKVILKILVFKKIVKFIALVCLLFFLPTINDNSTNDNDTDETNRKLKSDENSTSEYKKL